MNALERAQKAAERFVKEREIQMPDYEWMRIRHEKKMKLRALAKMAGSLDSLHKNLTGRNPW